MIIIGEVLKNYVCLLDEIEQGLFRVQHVTSLVGYDLQCPFLADSLVFDVLERDWRTQSSGRLQWRAPFSPNHLTCCHEMLLFFSLMR